MAEEPREERSAAIREAAERYLANRWHRQATVFLAVLPDLVAAGAAMGLLSALALVAVDTIDPWRRGGDVGPWVLLVVCVGVLVSYAAFAGRWHRRALLLLQYQPMVVRPPGTRPARHGWLWMVLALYPGLTGYLLGDHLWDLAPRGQLLAMTVWWLAFLVLAEAVGRVTAGRWLQPHILLASAGAATAYAVAVYLGQPAPAVLLAREAELLRLLGPLAAILLGWFLASGVYGQVQFRRLQRLVNEGASEGSGDA